MSQLETRPENEGRLGQNCVPRAGSRLEEILNRFEAQPRESRLMAKHVGRHLGNGISHEDLENIIAESIDPQTGKPKWENVHARLAEPVKRLSRGEALRGILNKVRFGK